MTELGIVHDREPIRRAGLHPPGVLGSLVDVDELAFYRAPGAMTRLPAAAGAGSAVEPVEVARLVQGLIVHTHLVHLYGTSVDQTRAGDLQIRAADEMLERIRSIEGRPLAEARPPDDRFVGNCRHFSTLAVALLRQAGVPARARCGFAGYFQTGKRVDHWIVEHWDGDRWVRLDAQLDDVQRAYLAIDFDPTDIPEGRFLTAGDAWLRCRHGSEDPDTFGILDMWGRWFIEGNIARDLAALNKVEMLPWDGWGSLAGPEPRTETDEWVDEIAELTSSGDLAAITSRYDTDSRLRVPPDIVSYGPSGATPVSIPQLA